MHNACTQKPSHTPIIHAPHLCLPHSLHTQGKNHCTTTLLTTGASGCAADGTLGTANCAVGCAGGTANCAVCCAGIGANCAVDGGCAGNGANCAAVCCQGIGASTGGDGRLGKAKKGRDGKGDKAVGRRASG